MRKLLVVAAVFASLAWPRFAFAHGGTYAGPPGSAPTPGPTTPNGPTAPRSPAGPLTPADAPGSADDLTKWQYWWALNQPPYLQIKSHVNAGGPVTGSDEYKLGKGSNDNTRDALRVSASTVQIVIIPRLLDALRTESSNDIQSSCMIALAKIGDPGGPAGGSLLAREVQREIAKRLVSPCQELSETAAVALGISGRAENIALLTAVLENDLARLRSFDLPTREEVSVRTRAFAAYGLGLIGYRAGEYDRLVINATLRKLLEGEGQSMAQRDVPAACLTAIGLTPLSIDKNEFDFRNPRKSRLSGVMVGSDISVG